MRDIVFKCVVGSHLYGTNIEGSDTDVKTIFFPTAKQILVQKIPHVVSNGDVDEEFFSISKFLKLLYEGQTTCFDMIFAPAQQRLIVDSRFSELSETMTSLINKDCGAFVGYCKTQAIKYGNKGQRLEALLAAQEFFSQWNSNPPDIQEVMQELNEGLLTSYPTLCRTFVRTLANNVMVEYFECCGRSVPLGASVKEAARIFRKAVSQYGKRVNSTFDGKDWKALMHAVRVGEQCIELLDTGHITFPRPNADYLRLIRLGRLDFSEVSDLIDHNLERIEISKKNTFLPDKPPSHVLEQAIAEIHAQIVRKFFNSAA